MKITEVSTQVVGNPWKNWIFVELKTDEGVTGLGEATGGLETAPIEAQVRELGGLVVGEDPRNPGALWQKMYKAKFLNGSPAMSGIEIACWDILGKTLNAPLWQLLGGRQRPKLRAYANGWYRGPRDPGFFAEAATRVKEMGYTALKFDPFGAAYRVLDRAEEALSIGLVAAVRSAVGGDVDLCIEGHDRFDVPTAIRVARWLEEFRPMWFETPVMSTDVRQTVEVARRVEVAIAAGERYRRLSEIQDLVADRAVAIVQPEPMNIGGVSGAVKAAAIAESCEASVALHQAQSPLCTAVNAHLHAAAPNFLIQECFDDFLEPWTWDVLSGVPRVENGYVTPPDVPGVGVFLDKTEAKKHPYSPKNFLRLFQEGWETRGRDAQ